MAMTTVPTPKNRILKRPEVEAMTGFSKSTLYARIAAGEFPKPVKLGGANSRSVGWPESAVNDWIEARMAEAGYDSENAA
jgi:prophage regulatory protein